MKSGKDDSIQTAIRIVTNIHPVELAGVETAPGAAGVWKGQPPRQPQPFHRDRHHRGLRQRLPVTGVNGWGLERVWGFRHRGFSYLGLG